MGLIPRSSAPFDRFAIDDAFPLSENGDYQLAVSLRVAFSPQMRELVGRTPPYVLLPGVTVLVHMQKVPSQGPTSEQEKAAH